MSATELLSWAQANNHSLWAFRVRDKFGDYGLCGIGSLARNGATAQIVDFLLSCRVMGRGVEESMLAAVLQHAKDAGCSTVCAEYISTVRNAPLRKWLQSLPAVQREGDWFVFALDNPIVFPVHVRFKACDYHEKVSG
jgi:FkbH-like protein